MKSGLVRSSEENNWNWKFEDFVYGFCFSGSKSERIFVARQQNAKWRRERERVGGGGVEADEASEWESEEKVGKVQRERMCVFVFVFVFVYVYVFVKREKLLDYDEALLIIALLGSPPINLSENRRNFELAEKKCSRDKFTVFKNLLSSLGASSFFF